jgi:hypothetical protein
LALRLGRLRGNTLAVALNVADKLTATTLRGLRPFRRLVLPLAAPTAAALGLSHAVRDVVPVFLRRSHIAVPATHLATHLCGRRQRTLVQLHLG